jgi:histidinol-phosphate aminotransferase
LFLFHLKQKEIYQVLQSLPILSALPPVIHGAPDHSELARLGLNPAQVIDFSANSNPYGPHPSVLEAVAAAVNAETLARYPDRDCLALRAAIAAAEKVAEVTVLPGNGTLEMIQLIALAFVRPSSRHLILAPTFGEYARAIQLLGGQVHEYWSPAASGNLYFNPETVAATIRQLQPDSIWLCNPNNPTGQQWTAAELAHLRAADSAQQALWVIDESYRHFAANPTPLDGWAEGKNIIILRSLTKDQALAGLRLGYAIAAPALIAALRAVQPTWSVNSLAQVAGVAALQAPVLAWRQDSLACLRHHAADLWAGLSNLDFEVLPTATTYSLVKVDNAAAFRHQLLIKGLQVRDCASFGLPQQIRIAARQPAENEQLLAAIKLQKESAPQC